MASMVLSEFVELIRKKAGANGLILPYEHAPILVHPMGLTEVFKEMMDKPILFVGADFWLVTDQCREIKEDWFYEASSKSISTDAARESKEVGLKKIQIALLEYGEGMYVDPVVLDSQTKEFLRRDELLRIFRGIDN